MNHLVKTSTDHRHHNLLGEYKKQIQDRSRETSKNSWTSELPTFDPAFFKRATKVIHVQGDSPREDSAKEVEDKNLLRSATPRWQMRCGSISLQLPSPLLISQSALSSDDPDKTFRSRAQRSNAITKATTAESPTQDLSRTARGLNNSRRGK